MPRVAFLTPGWPLASFPNGIVSYVANLREPLRSLGFETAVLAAESVGEITDPEAVCLDLQHRSLPIKLADKVLYRLFPRQSWPLRSANAIEASFRRLQQRGRIDLFEMEESFGNPIHLRRRLGVPVIVRLHGPWFLNGPALGVPEDREYHWRVRAEKKAIATAAAVTSPSQDVLDAVRQRFGLRLADAEVIPNPGPPVEPAQCWSARECEPETVVFVGRFDAHKGGDLMIDAFARVAEQRPSAKLLFAGPDRGVRTGSTVVDLPTYLTSRVHDPDVRARIHQLGPQSEQQVAALRRRGAVTVVASRYENFPMTVVEALAFGTPLVLAAAGGMKEMVNGGVSGLFFKAGDPSDLADQLSSLLRDPASASRLAAGARTAYETRFAPAVVGRAMGDYYGRLLARWSRV